MEGSSGHCACPCGHHSPRFGGTQRHGHQEERPHGVAGCQCRKYGVSVGAGGVSLETVSMGGAMVVGCVPPSSAYISRYWRNQWNESSTRSVTGGISGVCDGGTVPVPESPYPTRNNTTVDVDFHNAVYITLAPVFAFL